MIGFNRAHISNVFFSLKSSSDNRVSRLFREAGDQGFCNGKYTSTTLQLKYSSNDQSILPLIRGGSSKWYGK